MTASITRKQFCARMAGASVALLFEGCGGGGDSAAAPAPSTPPAPAVTRCSDTIAANHGHVLAVAVADLASLVDLTYDIHGTATHTHSVTLSAADLATLKAGMNVSTVSTVTLAHQHTISVLCT